MAASPYHGISKEVKNHIFRQNWIFRHMYHMCMYKQPTLTIQWNYNFFLCKYDIVTVISDTLVDSFLGLLFLLLAVILSELLEKPRRKEWVKEKST